MTLTGKHARSSFTVPISGVKTSANRRVLIVDDRLPLLALLSILLEYDGYMVETACSAKEALTTAAEFHPKVIFVCADLPVTTGYELAKAFRSELSTPVSPLPQ